MHLFNLTFFIKDNVSDRVPQAYKEKAPDHIERFLTEEYFPEDRRDQFIFRGKKARTFSHQPADATSFSHRIHR
jgi:hypothetical protein